MRRLSGNIAILIAAFLSIGSSAASTEKILYSFPSGSYVQGQIQEDQLGNLYVATVPLNGRGGTIFQLTQQGGVWGARPIYVFKDKKDGSFPAAGLTQGASVGVLYGTTSAGGSHGDGTVFALVRTDRKWTEKVLHSFAGYDGSSPVTVLTRDRVAGILYGTAFNDGPSNCGTAFRLDPANRRFNVLYNFQGGQDGCLAKTQLREGWQTGTLFGGTLGGGGNNCGTLFQLTKTSGSWNKSVLHAFTCTDGSGPEDIATPSDDPGHSIYGVALGGGKYNQGVVFELSNPRDNWVYKIVYAFTGGTDGRYPIGLRLDRVTGVLYGTTLLGGSAGKGVVFKLAKSGGRWTETVLHSFTGAPVDGDVVESRPIIDPKTGVLYGTTYAGGAFDSGAVYSLTP